MGLLILQALGSGGGKLSEFVTEEEVHELNQPFNAATIRRAYEIEVTNEKDHRLLVNWEGRVFEVDAQTTRRFTLY